MMAINCAVEWPTFDTLNVFVGKGLLPSIPAMCRNNLAYDPRHPLFSARQCGAWGCFDEFNRLKEDQLSAISQQIQIIQDAIKAKRPSLK